jgi:hypothetical protein
MIVISKQTARRFVLGRQGLWPGRRWRGKPGVVQALRACEAVQLDPLNIFARSQDIVLHSRVLDYKPGYLYKVMYEERKFFDYGGGLFVYPMEELPYFRVHMQGRSHDKRVEDFVFTHDALFEQARSELRKRGPLGNRDFEGNRVAGWNYRGRKDTSLALFDMWLSGELMIHHREGFERVYDFRENVAPKEFDYAASVEEAEKFFARKAVAFMGLFREKAIKTSLKYDMRRDYSSSEAESLIGGWKEMGLYEQVQVEGGRETFLVLAEDVPLLDTLERGRVPRVWKPKETTTLEEVTFLSPLDIVSARGRAKTWFDFEYKWEVYTPAHLRRWGYYVLPILYGDDLAARLDPKLDRATGALHILNFHLEEDAPTDEAFASALGRGLARLAKMVGAKRVDVKAIKPVKMRDQVRKLLTI